MTESPASSFRHVTLPAVGKRVLRLGVAGNYGIESADVHYAAERGVRYWVWASTFRKVIPALRDVLRQARDEHVVSGVDRPYGS